MQVGRQIGVTGTIVSVIYWKKHIILEWVVFTAKMTTLVSIGNVSSSVFALL